MSRSFFIPVLKTKKLPAAAYTGQAGRKLPGIEKIGKGFDGSVF